MSYNIRNWHFYVQRMPILFSEWMSNLGVSTIVHKLMDAAYQWYALMISISIPFNWRSLKSWQLGCNDTGHCFRYFVCNLCTLYCVLVILVLFQSEYFQGSITTIELGSSMQSWLESNEKGGGTWNCVLIGPYMQ